MACPINYFVPTLLFASLLLLVASSKSYDQSSGMIGTNKIEERGQRFKRNPDMSNYYVKLLFWRFDNDETEYLSLANLEKFVEKIGLGAMLGHGHNHSDHGHDHGGHGDDHDDHGHDHGDHGHDHGDHGDDHDNHGHDHHDHGHDHDDHGHDHHDHGHDHDDHGHDHHDHGHDHHDHGHDHHDHRHKRATSNETEGNTDEPEKCMSLKKLLEDYGLDQETEFDQEDFLHLSPALLDLLVTGVCKNQDHDHDHSGHNHSEHGQSNEDDDSRNMGLVWFYMMLCVTAISLCAVWGILCIPKRSRSVYHKVIQFLMALAAGSMAGDALLHLLPHALMPPHDHSAHGHEGHDHGGHDHGGHGHDDHGSHDDLGDHGDEHMQALLKGLVALIGLYAFFFLERGFAVYMARAQKNRKTASTEEKEVATHMLHSHGEPLDDIKFITTSPSNDTAITELAASPVDGPCRMNGNGKTHHWPHPGNNENITDLEASNENRQRYQCPKLTPLALMIVLGDLFHNFCDGLAIGAAFSSNTTIGFSTSIAVFCHELPHEIGDFAVLIKSGLSNKQAICLNFVSALSCYLGAMIGMVLGNVGNAPMWIFAGVGGMFLYIALVDLVPEMTHVYMTPGNPWTTYLSLHAAGLILGAAIMLVLGIYEHDIQMALA